MLQLQPQPWHGFCWGSPPALSARSFPTWFCWRLSQAFCGAFCGEIEKSFHGRRVPWPIQPCQHSSDLLGVVAEWPYESTAIACAASFRSSSGLNPRLRIKLRIVCSIPFILLLLSEVLKIVLNGGIEVCTKSVRPSFEVCRTH